MPLALCRLAGGLAARLPALYALAIHGPFLWRKDQRVCIKIQHEQCKMRKIGSPDGQI